MHSAVPWDGVCGHRRGIDTSRWAHKPKAPEKKHGPKPQVDTGGVWAEGGTKQVPCAIIQRYVANEEAKCANWSNRKANIFELVF